MSESPASLFLRSGDLESFRRSVVALGGDFTFDETTMNDLGRVYFERHPDRSHDRNLDDVRLGYGLVRVCAVEKAVAELPENRRAFYREIFDDVSRVAPVLAVMLESATVEELASDLATLRAALARIKGTIDELPKGMIKERFVGGVSNLFNILYVLGMRIPNLTTEAGALR